MTPAREPGQAPVLVTRLGGQQRIFPVGEQVRVGRDPTFELVSVNPLVSRQCHGVITSDQGGATYVDQSRRGTFLDGRQLSGPLRITESVVLRLGDPATGEELGITPPLTSTQIAHNHGRRVLGGRIRRGVLVGAAIAAVAGLATYGFFALRPAGGGLGGGQRTSVLRHAEAATVRLVMGSLSDNIGSGSGTVISSTGMILTNSPPGPAPKPTHPATPAPTGPRLAAGVAPLTRLLPADIGDPTSQCRTDPPPYTWDMPGRVAALDCTDPGLPKGKVYAFQMDSQADYEATWASYSKVVGFTDASPGQDCPPAKGGVGTFPTDSKMFPHRPGQVLWCEMVDAGNGPQPVYTWTLPAEDAFFVAAGAPNSSFAALDTWWRNNSLPQTAPSPSAS
jgi:hypothetical protein